MKTEHDHAELIETVRSYKALGEALEALESLDEKLKYLDCRLSPKAMKRIDRIRKVASEQWDITFNAWKRSRKEIV